MITIGHIHGSRISLRGPALLIFLIVAHTVTLIAQRSPFNGLQVEPPDSSGHYRFIVGGHFYGDGIGGAGFPVNTLLGNLDTINELGASFLISTGDMFQDAQADRDRYRRSLFDKLVMPLFNAVGNHDLDGGQYERLYGGTGWSFDAGADRFIILDTERDDSSILGDQLKLLTTAAEDAEAGKLRRVFIISHRPVWAESAGSYSELFANNTRSLTGGNFDDDVSPILQAIAKSAEVCWISGSMGGSAPASIFFQPHSPGITYIQCAIRGEPRDALLIADVNTDSVRWSGLSLTGQVLMPVEEYTAEWWRDHLGRPTGFRWKLIPYYITSTLTHRAFWSGAVSVLLVIALGRWSLRKRAGSRD